MNAANTYRNSILGGPSLPPTGSDAGLRRRTVTAARRQTFVALDWTEYVAECKAHRNSVAGGPYPSPSQGQWQQQQQREGVYDVSREPDRPTGVVRVLRQVGRMATVLPVRDANWLVAIIFVVGSVSFTVNGALGLHLLFAAPGDIFPGEAEVAVPATNMLGAALFTVGAFLSMPAIWNTDNGTLDLPDSDASSISDQPAKIYHPALLGSAAWRWTPGRAALRRLLGEPPFQAALVQLAGTMVLAPSAVVGLPGVLAPDNLLGLAVGVFTPLLVGGGLIFLASAMLLLFSQRAWYRPELASAAWYGSLCNTVGAACFSLGGALLLINEAAMAGEVVFAGSVVFLIGSLIQWYDLVGSYWDY